MSYRPFLVGITFLVVVGMVCGAAERAAVSGKITDDTGKPVEHATVLVYEAYMRHGYGVYCPTCWVDCGKHAITDAQGKYSIAGLSPDLVFKLLVVRGGYKTIFVNKVDPSKGNAADAALKLRLPATDPSQTVKGRVIDAHGNPVKDAVVEQQEVTTRARTGLDHAFGPDESPDWLQPLAATDEQGEFEIAYAKPAVEFILRVAPRAMAPRLVTLATGSEKKTITVTEGVTLRGRLVQPDGTPMRDAEIEVVTHSRRMGTTFTEVRMGTRDDGTFAITNIPAGRIWYVYPTMESVAARGLVADAIPLETKDDGQEIDLGTIHLRAAYTLRGKIMLTDGKPIPPRMHMTLSSDAGFDSQIVDVAKDGTFQFRGLSKGVYSLEPGIRGYKPTANFYDEVLIDHDNQSLSIAMSPVALR